MVQVSGTDELCPDYKNSNSENKKANNDATTKAGGAKIADMIAPAIIAKIAIFVPSLLCTKSRKTSANPIITTPLGAIKPGATGSRQGPLSEQTVPMCSIN